MRDFSGSRCRAPRRQPPALGPPAISSDPTMESAGTGCNGPRLPLLRRFAPRAAGSCLSRRDFRLQAKDVSVLYSSLAQCLRILDLPPRILVMELVTQRRTVRAVGRQTQLLHQYHDDLVAGRVVWKLHRNALVFRRVIHRHVDRRHRLLVPSQSFSIRLLAMCENTAVPCDYFFGLSLCSLSFLRYWSR